MEGLQQTTHNTFARPTPAVTNPDKKESGCEQVTCCSRLYSIFKTILVWIVYICSCTCLDYREGLKAPLLEGKEGFYTLNLKSLPPPEEIEERNEAIKTLTTNISRAIVLLKDEHGTFLLKSVNNTELTQKMNICMALSSMFAQLVIDSFAKSNLPYLVWRVVPSEDMTPSLEFFAPTSMREADLQG